jgi:integrase
MKAGREHRVPLSGPALAVLKKMNEICESDFVFPGRQKGHATLEYGDVGAPQAHWAE